MLTTQDIDQKEADIRSRLTQRERERDEAALEAVTDQSLNSTRDRLRIEVRALEDDLADLAGARRAARVHAQQAEAESRREECKKAFAAAQAWCGELSDLAVAADEGAEHLRTIFTRMSSINDAIKRTVASQLRGPEMGNARMDLALMPTYQDSPLAETLRRLGPIGYGPHTRNQVTIALRQIAKMLEINIDSEDGE